MNFTTHLRCRVVRAAKPRWSYLPTSGEGAARRGGRFNQIGEPALYTSLSHETAAREVRFSLNQEPYTFYFLAVDCQDVVDLTAHDVRQGLGIGWDDLANDNWEAEMHRGVEPSPHAITAGLKQDGHAGILVNSFAPGATPDDINLVLWTWDAVDSLPAVPRNAVTVLNRDDLPGNDASWR